MKSKIRKVRSNERPEKEHKTKERRESGTESSQLDRAIRKLNDSGIHTEMVKKLQG